MGTITSRTDHGFLKEILVPCDINGKLIECVVDTGASMSIINKNLIKDSLRNGKTHIKPTNLEVITATGERAGVLGTAKCKVKINNTVCYADFLVAPNMLQDTLLGMDVLATCPATKNHIIALRNAFKQCDKIEEDEETQKLRIIEEDKKVIAIRRLSEKIQTELSTIEAKSLKDLTTTDVLEHKITVKNVEPIRQKTRRIPFAFQKDFKNTVEEMLGAKIIEESVSSWSSPVKLVKKKDGSIRVTVDYRKLNSVTVKDAYPIPRIDSMLCKLVRLRYLLR